MGVLSELGLGTREADIEYVKSFVREYNFGYELERFLGEKGLIQEFGDIKISSILDDLKSDLIVQAIVAGSKLSMAICEGHGGNSERAREVRGWVPDVSEETEDWFGFHEDKMRELIQHILNNK